MSDEHTKTVTREDFERLRGRVHTTAAITNALLELTVRRSSDPAKALALMRENHLALVDELGLSNEPLKSFSQVMSDNFDKLESALSQHSDPH